MERYPEIDSDSQSSVPGIYIVGDLTGIPLLKPASESGAKVARHFLADKDFASRCLGEGNRDRGEGRIRDVLIVGGGPAGIACALECRKNGLDYEVLESSRLFSTIGNFPKGKPILARPEGYREESLLAIRDGFKETLLEDLNRQIAGRPLEVRLGERVEAVRRKGGVVIVKTGSGELPCLRCVIAAGKTGNARRLGIPGEDLPHVFNRLIDPGEFRDGDILVVGGGDSALEAAAALAQAGNRVALSHRKPRLDRPKPETLERFQSLLDQGRIQALPRSRPKAIRAGETVLETPDGERTVKSGTVFVLIGRDPPLAFLKRSGLRMAGERDRAWYVFLAAMLSFFSMLYFGKVGTARDVFQGADSFAGMAAAYLSAPFTPSVMDGMKWSLHHYSWYPSLAFLLGWAGSLAFLVSGSWALGIMIRRRGKYFGSRWAAFKYGYFIATAAGFAGVYFHYMLGRDAGWVEGPTYFYSLSYSLTILIFGARRMLVKKTRYVRYQTLSLVVFQVVFLFLLPFHLFDPFIKANFAADGFVMREMFPSGKWSSFGFVLFWPLNMNDFGTSVFWTWFPLVQTFGVLLFIVLKWGKGAYCGWICSCGGMAETLGDEYRTQAPHGPGPKRLENIGQFVLFAALIVTAFGYFTPRMGLESVWADTLEGAYKLSIDVFFAGVLGLGVYFFLSGRVWCRFGCPLAALMHVYNRFSRYRIFAEKKKCISCNVCTKVCHMGIDVMSYANKGLPMDDVQCVSCSACVQACPTETLSFGILKTGRGEAIRDADPERSRESWTSGLR